MLFLGIWPNLTVPKDTDLILVESHSALQQVRRNLKNKTEVMIYDEHVEKDPKLNQAIDPLFSRHKCIVLYSDAGHPCIGDPGCKLVRRAHELEIPVRALQVASPILTSIALSGCDGNRFEHLGYPPVKSHELSLFFQSFRKKAGSKKTFSLIETPYRFEKTLRSLLDHAAHSKNGPSWVSVSIELGTENEKTQAASSEVWATKRDQWIKEFPTKSRGVIVFEI